MKNESLKNKKQTPRGEAFKELILEVFRLNGALLAKGDRLTGDYGLSSARWQVLASIEEKPIPVSQIARNMGLSRQSVQRIANILHKEGFVEFIENPNHKRAKLIKLSIQGADTLKKINKKQIEWLNIDSHGFEIDKLKNAVKLMRAICQRLKVNND